MAGIGIAYCCELNECRAPLRLMLGVVSKLNPYSYVNYRI